MCRGKHYDKLSDWSELTLFCLVKLTLCVLFFLWLPCRTQALTNGPSLDELKVAFLYRFSKFTYWNGRMESRKNSALRFCFLNSPRYSEIARQSYGRENVTIHDLKFPNEISSCDVVYVRPSPTTDVDNYLQIAKNLPILTVDEEEWFLESGGILRFLFNEKKQLRFEINPAQSKKVGIRFKAQFLRLAKIWDSD